MTALLLYPGPVPVGALKHALQGVLPDISVRVWPDVGDVDDIRFALVSRIPNGALARLPQLALVGSLHAGVDGLLADPTLPSTLPITRPMPADGDLLMSEFILAQVLRHHRDMPAYARAQREARWVKLPILPIAERTVGVLGMGAMGMPASALLSHVGFNVAGWARRPRPSSPWPLFHGEAGLSALLARSHILVNLLPLTPSTRDLVNADLLAQLQPGAAFINVGRGEHVVDADLIDALDSGRLSAASLDVFVEEPLPPESPLWRHPAITITPHAARQVDILSVVGQFASEVRRVQAGLPPVHAVDRESGY